MTWFPEKIVYTMYVKNAQERAGFKIFWRKSWKWRFPCQKSQKPPQNYPNYLLCGFLRNCRSRDADFSTSKINCQIFNIKYLSEFFIDFQKCWCYEKVLIRALQRAQLHSDSATTAAPLDQLPETSGKLPVFRTNLQMAGPTSKCHSCVTSIQPPRRPRAQN